MVFDVAIVGAGPAGLFAALALMDDDRGRKPSIVMLDRGRAIKDRSCPAREELPCLCACQPCALTSGVGGAGLFSDGKLVLDLGRGGHLGELSHSYRDSLLSQVLSYVKRFDGSSSDYGGDLEVASSFEAECRELGLVYYHYLVRHFGPEVIRNFAARLTEHLVQAGLELRPQTKVVGIRRSDSLFVLDHEGSSNGGPDAPLEARAVVMAVGKDGAAGHDTLAHKLGLAYRRNHTWIGVRLVVRSDSAAPLVRATLDPKIWLDFPDRRRAKTHCFGHPGEVLVTKYCGLPLAGGQGLRGERLADSSTFAVLVSDTDAQPWTWDTCEKAMQMANAHGPSLIHQSMAEFLGVPMRPAADGWRPSLPKPSPALADVRACTEELGIWSHIEQLLKRLEKLAPGLLSEDHMVYWPAIEWWMPRLELTSDFETSMPGLFAAGDGAGLTQGIIQAAASGLVAGAGVARALESRAGSQPYPEYLPDERRLARAR